MSGVEEELVDEMLTADVFGRMSDDRAVSICAALAKVAARYFGEQIDGVSVVDARIGVEWVSAYGLDIEVDANGRASTVHFPDGAVLC